MAAWNDRRSTPVIFELANLKSSICEVDKETAVGSVTDGIIILPRHCGHDILPELGDYFPKITLSHLSPGMLKVVMRAAAHGNRY
jgi:hypothetical protein